MTVDPMKLCFNLPRDIQQRCFSPEAMEQLATLAELKPETPVELTADWLLAQAADCDGVICGWGSLPLDDALLAAAPRLRLALHSAGTIRGFETPAMWRRGLRVTSAANVNGVPVAEFALGLILMCFRDVFAQVVRFREHGRAAWTHTPVLSYYGTTVGIIGMGNVGKHLLRLLAPFKFKKLVHSFYPFEDQAAAAGAECVEIDELMARADAVVLLAPNIPANHHLIDARRLGLMRDGRFFINPGRGALVDEPALIAELQSGRLTACLDVTDPEPPVEGSPLYSLPNCILTPHIAGSTEVECLQLGDQVVNELRHYVAGEPFDNEITEELSGLIG